MHWSDLTAKKKRSSDQQKCQVCGEQGTNIAEFNLMQLCPKCFHDEIAAFVEGRKFKVRVAVA